MKLLFTLLVLLVALATQASAGVLFERSVVPAGWVMSSPSPVNAVVSFIIALKQRNLAELDAKFWSVSDPEHADFQNYLSPAEIQAFVAPEPAVVASVEDWLLSHGIEQSSMKNYGDAIEVQTTVSRASALFDTKFFMFKNEKTGKIVNKAWGAYSVPDFIHANIDFVEGVSTFAMPRISSLKHVNQPLFDRFPIVVPQFTQQLYSMPSLGSLSNPATSHGVIEFGEEFFSNNDTAMFNVNTSWNAPMIADAQIVGVNDDTSPGGESTLDVQWQAGLNPSATPWFWIEADHVWVYGWAVHFLQTKTVPQVASVSYGWWEADECRWTNECQSLGINNTQYVVRTNVEFQKIAICGVSLLISSGDSGANGRTNSDCSVPQLRAAFPASSPYVTAVGGTEIRNPVFNLPNAPPMCSGRVFTCVSGGVEAAVSVNFSSFTSGGGFSNITRMPSYQYSAVQAYLASGVQLPPASYFNSAGRAIPDVAALGQNGYTVMGGNPSPASGTSMSAPIFSGVISLLNAEAIKISGQPLGFLNQWLYSLSGTDAFQDITLGDNICTEDGCADTCKGFYAAKGWDPVTGLGTPNYASMLKHLKAMFARRKAKGL